MADRKKSNPATKSERLRPKRVAIIPEMALPIMQPISALDDVNPCQKPVYTKSLAPRKKA